MFEINGRRVCPPKLHLLLEALVALAWLAAIIAVNAVVKPRRQGFYCDDDSIKYPYGSSTVGNEVITAVTIALPALMMAVVEIRTCLCLSKWRGGGGGGGRQRGGGPWPVVGAFLTYFFGYELLTMAVILLKLTTGQLRPHFLAVCRPDVTMDNCHGYVSEYNCTNTEADSSLLESARKSFPSGHAAAAVYMALFMMLYFEQRLTLRHYPLLRLTSYAVLTLYALWCSATRVSDHMHHVTDVVAGGLLGILVAIATFYRGARGCLQEGERQVSPSDEEAARSSIPAINTSNSAIKARDDDNDDEEEEGSAGMETPGSPGSPIPLLFPGLQAAAPSGRHGSFMLERVKNNFRTFSLR